MLTGLLKAKQYDLIHTHFSKDLWVLVPALHYLRLDTPLILTKHMESAVIKKDYLHNKLYRRLNYVLAISNRIKENVSQTCPVSDEKIVLHYTGVDFNKYDPVNGNREKVRNEFHIKEDEIVIGILARITYGKGYEELLHSAAILNKEYTNLKFLLVGDSSPDEKEYCNEIKKLAVDLSLGDKIIFTGFREDTENVLSAMDIFTFPSYAESFGNALVEAMAMEKPAVGTNSHGVLDIIDDEGNGYFFNKKDQGSLADKIRLLINSPEKRSVIGKAARQSVIAKFDFEKQTEKLIDLYKKLV